MKVFGGLVVLLVLTTATALARPDPSLLPEGFSSEVAELEDVRLHYVIGGEGEPLILLHGWGSTWYMWRKVMPALAERYTVVAPDLPGLGDSSVPKGGFDKATTAERIRALVQDLGFSDINLVGHDIGLMVAYAYAAAHPDEVRHLALIEAPIPDASIYTFPAITESGFGAWNFGFFSFPEMPETIIAGQERYFLEQFVRALTVNQDAFTDADFAEYARTYAQPGKLRSSFEYFRAFPEDVAQNETYAQTPLSMPVLALGAEGSLGGFIPQQVENYADNLQGGVIEGSGHWVPEEVPDRFAASLLTFLEGE